MSEILITAAKKIHETVKLYNSGIKSVFGTSPIIKTKTKHSENKRRLCLNLVFLVAKILILTSFEKIRMLKSIKFEEKKCKIRSIILNINIYGKA